MAYRIIISPQAQVDIEDAFDFYATRSETAPSGFINDIEEAYSNLSLNPFYRVRYKDFRVLPLKRFPFILIFLIDDDTVIIKGCFHTSKNTSKYPR
ncbi:hypothetical protein CHU92_03550 [Flavobacterium cyanobacteriorum]|uniref:Type II toxin-antitoxin system RelE/ParE family toxin n=1 Tax=Flavobacterium cyanobacteriorum TaxID=2022802 RepID=A0A255ZP46_9FLAO|nr:type II toxin-antitoxin system RelE/ParE family toxin [Flavobacterium cyanobacteriorum]OYQ43283.1 hypothetical protein CHU92_03550 [Flavobacterium cyanobacteriorum]